MVQEVGYLDSLLQAALLHDMGKIDNTAGFSGFKRFVNQGMNSADYLRTAGYNNNEALHYIERHHKRTQGDIYLRDADSKSASCRLFGGNVNKHLLYLPVIDCLVFNALETLFSNVYTTDDLERTILRCPWLDIVPADLNASLESQSLRQHLIQTKQILEAQYNEADPPVLYNKVSDRKATYELIERAISGRPTTLFIEAGVCDEVGELMPNIRFAISKRKKEFGVLI